MSILVVLEPQGDGLKRSSYEALTAARSIASGAAIHGIVFNATESQLSAAGAYGLATCMVVAGSEISSKQRFVAAAIAEAAASCSASTVIFSANAFGKDVAPRVAVRMNAGLLADCTELSGTAAQPLAVRPVYAGKAKLGVKSTTPSTVLTLRPNVFTAKADAASTVAAQAFAPTVDATMRSTVVTGVSKNEGSLEVSEADMVVSGGRGLKGPENFHLVENLAKSLGAAVGASRAVVDAGWRPHREQVGQTGKTVSPTLYVAVGISGAVQHLAGMSSSKIIVAVNKDKDAPIFSVADYGIVGDAFEILPRLTSRIGAITGRG